MRPKFSILSAILACLVGVFLIASQAQAAEPIAKVVSFKGEVIIQSDIDVFKLTQLGQILNGGDRVQTREGEVQIAFNDGAILKVRPFTNLMIQEREEKRGFWLFKTTQLVRRVTCFVGKLWFKSGVSKRKNYLQSPTSVIGIRGSDGDFSFNMFDTCLNLYAGEAEIVGEVVREFCPDTGIDAAEKSKVYQALTNAFRDTQQAKATKRPVHLARAKVACLKVHKEAAVELQRNPDDLVRKYAEVDGVVADARIAAAEAEEAVEKIKEAKEAAEKTADQAEAEGDEETAEQAREAAETAEEALLEAEEKAEEAEEAAEEAMEAGEDLDLEAAQEAADKAQEASEEAKAAEQETTEIVEEVVTTTEETTAEETTEESTVETTEETTEETTTTETTEETTTTETTAETTTMETTTSSTTTSTTTTTTTTEETTASPSL